MTKLQKNSPPAYSNAPSSTGLGVPYEDLPPSAQMPVPIATPIRPSSYTELASTNPFSPNFTPPQSLSSAPSSGATAPRLFSPVSPLADSASMEKPSQTLTASPVPQRPSANRNPVNLQRLDGSPYSSKEARPKQVRVAKDMFDGALPPSYKRQGSDPARRGDSTQTSSSLHDCTHCGKTLSEGQTGPCTGCGKRKSSAQALTRSTGAAPASHNRNTSAGVASQRSIASSTTAGPASPAGSSSSPAPCCSKCGRHKRPGSIGHSSSPPPSHSTNMRLQSAGLSIQPNHAGQHTSFYPQIDIIPPSATTFRPQSTFASVYGDEAPLVNHDGTGFKRHETGRSSFRNNSIVRSLSRRLSRKEKDKAPATPNAPLPSQQFSSPSNRQSDSQSAGRLISMISSTMPDESSNSRNGPQYSRLTAADDERPSTPFSFVEGPDEDGGFEMTSLKDKPSSSGQKKIDDDSYFPPTQPGVNGEYFPNQEDRLDVIPRPKTADPHRNFLSPDHADPRAQITRFKSLRSGVNRVNAGIGSISRSQSLRRLGSVKTVHHAWYRDGTDENSVPVF